VAHLLKTGACVARSLCHSCWTILVLLQDQDPAAFSAEMIRVSRDILLTRYRLLPFLYTLLHFAHVSGSTVVRPLLHEYEPPWAHPRRTAGGSPPVWIYLLSTRCWNYNSTASKFLYVCICYENIFPRPHVAPDSNPGCAFVDHRLYIWGTQVTILSWK